MFAVIIAGGRGTRFWPLSRTARPKHLLGLNGPDPLLRQTVDRVLPLATAQRTLVVTMKSHADEVRAVLNGIPAKNILVEPVGKNTAPAIALAAAHVLDAGPDAIMAVLPSDHIISPPEKFLDDLREGARLAASGNILVTFGIAPARPETGYGYIEVGRKLSGKAFAVNSFKEKPNRKKAKDYIGTGRYLWNSGMFVFRAQTYMNMVKEHLPALYALWETYRNSPRAQDDLERYYAGAEGVSIDYGVMEKCRGSVAVVSAAFQWSDVGSWDAIDEIWKADAAGNRKQEGELVALSSRDNTVVTKKLVALLGVENLIVVETDDAILVCKKDRAQEIKSLVEEMEKRGLTAYL
ncbi:MAG: NTP transferase domain-containing protein [Nitrospinae bacterium]|nr:NTP transferase domain-containing protein [Nitrospinota bacterium]